MSKAKVQAVRDSTAAAASFMPDVGRADDPSGTFVLGTWRAVSSGEVVVLSRSYADICSSWLLGRVAAIFDSTD